MVIDKDEQRIVTVKIFYGNRFFIYYSKNPEITVFLDYKNIVVTKKKQKQYRL